MLTLVLPLVLVLGDPVISELLELDVVRLWDTAVVADTLVLPVKLELELRDKVTVILGLEDSVADRVALWVCDTAVLPVTLELVLWLCVATVLPVKLELELRDKVTVILGLEDSVGDTLVL